MKITKTAAGVTYEGAVDGQQHRVFIPVTLSPETPPTHEMLGLNGKWQLLGNGNYLRIAKKIKAQAS